MIKYSLRCAKSHEFEGWFKDSDTYERQEKRGLLECPACGTTKVERALMAPNLPTKGNARKPRRAAPVPAPADGPAEGQPQAAAMAPNMPPELRKALLELRGQVEKNCDYVGDKFAEEARKIHYGETDKRGIYGETSDSEAAALADEGIEFGRLPWVNKGN
ncbi:MAG: DUF1178 family protein [Rhodospirillales bacterium]|nr:DUF1178 family protein [Rhodospirillales bacterium]QQS14141.1 MAG: DUF1178 family protein [Rhodospirillales bacterium]